MLRRWVPSVLLFVTAVGCVVRLTRADDDPLPNGDVSGAPADCSQPPAEGRSAIASGPPRIAITGRTVELAALDAGPPVATDGGADGAAPATGQVDYLRRVPAGTTPPVAFQWSGVTFSARFKGADRVLAPMRVPIVYDRVFYDECNRTVEGGDRGQDGNDIPCNPDQLSKTACCRALDDVPIMVEVDGKVFRRAGLSRPYVDKNDPSKGRRPTAEIDSFEIATGLDPNVEHEIRLIRSIETDRGIFQFHGFTFTKGGQAVADALLPPRERPRLIEFIGDSITAGYGIYGKNASCRYSIYTQEHYDTFGAITGREFDADVISTSVSGIGAFRNNATGLNEDGTQKAADNNMLTLFERALGGPGNSDKADFEVKNGVPPTARLFDFSSARQPQVVVITLGTNDFFLGPPDPAQFYDHYKRLVERARSLYPKAHIFCGLPPMISDTQSDLPRTIMRDYLKRLISDFGGKGDQRVYHMEFLDQGVRNGLGCDFHPNVTTHRIVAEQLIGAIRSKTCW